MDERLSGQPETVAAKIRAAQIHQLHQQTWTGLLGVLVVAFSACFILWDVVPQWRISLWAGLFTLLVVIRGILITVFQRKDPKHVDIDTWVRIHISGVVLSGLMWTVPSVFIWPEGQPLYQFVWPILILSVSGAGIATYCSWTPAYVSFVILTAGPIALRLMYEGGFVLTFIGALSLFFIGLLLHAGRLMHGASVKALEFGIRNEALNTDLRKEITARESLNDQLQHEISERTLSEETLSRKNQELVRLNVELSTTKSNLEASNIRLEEALANVKELSGMLPMCASCKNIRNDQGYWEALESYFKDHSSVVFSHGICPDCAQKLYPDIYKKKKK